MKQGDSDRVSHYYSTMPSLKRTKDKGKKRGGGSMRPLPNKQSMIQTPAPDQVASDLIDATCHEILSLEGDEGPDGSSIPSVASFAILAKRLDHYLGQLSVLKDDNVRSRLLLAKLVIDVCVRSAYPSDDDEGKDDTDTTTQKIPSLIEMTEDEWNSLARELGLVASAVSFSFESELSEPLNSLISQVEALVALATLRSQLSSGISEIEEDDANTPSKKRYKTFFSNLQESVDQYKQTMEKILKNHDNIDKNLFIPDAMLKIKRSSTVQRAKSSAISLVESIDNLVAKKAFPLKYLQVSLLALLKKLEKELPVPKLFELGYFGNGSSSTPPTSSVPTKKITSTSPVSPSATSSSSGQVISQREARKQTKKPEYRDESDSEEEEEEETPVLVEKKNGTKRKNEKFDSDSEDEVELKFAPSKKKVRRVPYSEEEKGALLQGVEEFGKGNWAKIRDHYADIFGVNKRTAVNLKDLYRTLTK